MKNIILAALLFGTFLLKSQDSLCVPHFGNFTNAGKYKIELGDCSEYIHFYLYTHNLKPLSNYAMVKGEAEFSYIDESYLTVKLSRGECNSIEAKIPESGFYRCRIILTLPDETIKATFDNECGRITGISKAIFSERCQPPKK